MNVIPFPRRPLAPERVLYDLEEALSDLEEARVLAKHRLERNAAERRGLEGNLESIEDDIRLVVGERIRQLVRIDEEGRRANDGR